MPERKLWTAEEDRVLKRLKQEQGCRKWSLIARIMQQQHGLEGRTGKQCRERYHNHLDRTITSEQWTSQQEQVLFRLHGQVGNKWSLIAQKLPGRTDNCVKNHFYSRLRKGARRLNKLTQEKPRKELSEVKINFLYKILEISESRFKTNCRHDQHLVEQCTDIKNQLYLLKDSEDSNNHDQQHLSRLTIAINTLESRLKKNNRSRQKEQRDSQATESKGSRDAPLKQEEDGGDPFYRVFKRVCEQMIKENPS